MSNYSINVPGLDGNELRDRTNRFIKAYREYHGLVPSHNEPDFKCRVLVTGRLLTQKEVHDCLKYPIDTDDV
jgi:hypothetical protein